VGVVAAAGAATCAAGAAGGASCDAESSTLLQVKHQEVQRHAFTWAQDLASTLERSLKSTWEALTPRTSHKDQAKFGAQASTTKSGKCLGTKVECASQTAGLVPEKSPQHAMWYNMPPQDLAQMQGFHADLTNMELPPLLANLSNNAVTIGYGPGAKVARMMYEATKVNGLSENLPRELRGVYWMKGNPVPEELMVIQYAQWHEEEGLLVLPLAPWSWSWAAGKPKDAPSDLYSCDLSAAAQAIQGLIMAQTALSAKFSTCKEGQKKTIQPVVCKANCEDKLAYGYLQLHQFGNLTEAANIGALLSAINNAPLLAGASGAFTLQKHPHAKDGSIWRRPSQWGIRGDCATVESGTYDLVKVIDADGNKVQPWHDEFVKDMGDVPLMTWTGWKSEEGRTHNKGVLEEVVGKMQTGELPKSLPVLQC